jgi:circadian clock protein KaiC
MQHKLKTVSSGIAGLDEVLTGGFPQGKIFLVEGSPGCGKTTLALQFLLEGRDRGERTLYITLSESVAELKSVSRTHGWDLKNIDLFELPIEEQLTADSQNTFFHTSEIELGATNQKLLDEIKRVKPHRVVIDSMTELKLMAQSPIRFRRQILAYKQFFLSQEITVMLLDDKTSSISDQEVQSIVHGIVKLEQLAPEYGTERRRLSIMKMRGTAFRGGYHDFSIRTGGIVVFPRLIAAHHGLDDLDGEISSGVAGIDALIGGGVSRGSSTLVMGPAGSGKSTLALKYAHHAADGGDRVAVFTFDEGLKTLFTRSKGLGIDLEPYCEKGLMSVMQVDPAQLSPGEFFTLVKKAVDEDKAKVVIIDSLNGYMNAMPAERYLIIQMHELLSYLSQMGVATFVVVVQHGLLGTAMETSIDVSYLADNVFLLRYFETGGTVRQAISVVKKRAGRHERTIRELNFSSQGIAVGEPLKNFQGILTGTPTIVSEASASRSGS